MPAGRHTRARSSRNPGRHHLGTPRRLRRNPHPFDAGLANLDRLIEQTDFRTEAIELALAHAVGSKVEAAYRRGELLEKRRLLSKAWGDFCLGLTPPAASNVIPFPGSAPDDRATGPVPIAASNPQRQRRGIPLTAPTMSITAGTSRKDRRQLELDF
jgi:hypothetical protein